MQDWISSFRPTNFLVLILKALYMVHKFQFLKLLRFNKHFRLSLNNITLCVITSLTSHVCSKYLTSSTTFKAATDPVIATITLCLVTSIVYFIIIIAYILRHYGKYQRESTFYSSFFFIEVDSLKTIADFYHYILLPSIISLIVFLE